MGGGGGCPIAWGVLFSCKVRELVFVRLKWVWSSEHPSNLSLVGVVSHLHELRN